MPSFSLSVNALRAKNSSRHSHPALTQVDLHWIGDLDFWGKSIAAPRICAGKSAGPQWAREAGHQQLVSDVAAAYLPAS